LKSHNYGWVLVGVAFLAVSVSFGPVVVFTFGVFLRPISEEFGWTRGEASLAFSVAALTVSLVSPLIGRMTDRYGARPIVVICASIYAAAYASLAWLTGALAQLYATYFVIGLVGNGATQLPYSQTITEWFDRRRGTALALMMTGVGLGIVVMPPLAQYLIDAYGWRSAYLALGGLMFAAAVPLPAMLLRRGGLAAQSSSTVAAPAGGMRVREAVRTQAFWIILVCFFLQSAALNGCVAHLAPMLTDGGLTAAQAAVAASILGGFTMAGRLTTGWMLDRFFAPRVAAAFFATATAGVLILLMPTTQTTALVAAALIGFSMGAEADAMPYLVSRYFGLRSFTELFGYTFSAYAVAGALGPGLMGVGFDRFGDYRTTMAGLAVAIAAGTLLLFRLPRFDRTEPQPFEEDLSRAAHPAS
jgi:MFS family permease